MELRSVEAIVGALNAAGRRELECLMDARLSLREKIQWLEDMETLHERFEQARIKRLREGNQARAADS